MITKVPFTKNPFVRLVKTKEGRYSLQVMFNNTGFFIEIVNVQQSVFSTSDRDIVSKKYPKANIKYEVRIEIKKTMVGSISEIPDMGAVQIELDNVNMKQEGGILVSVNWEQNYVPLTEIPLRGPEADGETIIHYEDEIDEDE